MLKRPKLSKAKSVNMKMSDEDHKMKRFDELLVKERMEPAMKDGIVHAADSGSESSFEENLSDSILSEQKTLNTYSFSLNHFTYEIYSYAIVNMIAKKKFNFFIEEVVPYSINTDYGVYTQIPFKGIIFINFKESIVRISFDFETKNIVLNSQRPLEEMIKEIEDYSKQSNFYLNKNMFIDHRFNIKMEKPDNVGFDNLILNEELKNDIYDNTVLYLREFDGPNGIIMYGPQGTGKTLTCTSVVNEVLKMGKTSIFLTEILDFSMLKTFIQEIVGDCSVTFEDVDSFAQDRRDMPNSQIASFLQLVSGISNIEKRICFIATTNYIEHLDEAVKNRPMRFNRKYFFDFPSDKEIDALIDLYFKGITGIDNKLCYKQRFTGSHIKEVRRTFDLFLKKSPDKDHSIVFSDSVRTLKSHFHNPSKIKAFE
jgi:predicted AAA+ superfamily ATPase